MTINIEPFRKYTKNEVMELLEYTPEQLKLAEEKKLIIFFEKTMHGILFFQFLKNNATMLEQIKNGE